MKKERFTGIESKCRNNSVEENIRKWEEMKKFSEEVIFMNNNYK